MTPEQLNQLTDDAQTYPLEHRIAAALVLDGVTLIQAREMLAGRYWFPEVKDQILARLTTLTFGQLEVTPRLEELARQLVTPQKIFIVCHDDYDGREPIGYFRSLKSAETFVEAQIEGHGWQKTQLNRWVLEHDIVLARDDGSYCVQDVIEIKEVTLA